MNKVEEYMERLERSRVESPYLKESFLTGAFISGLKE